MVGPAQLLRLLVVTAFLGAATGAPVSAAPTGLPQYPAIGASFEAGKLSEQERRILQVALAYEGDYAGPLDGIWDGASQEALDAYAEREFASLAKSAQVAALVIGFLAEVETRGWRYRYLADLDLSLALPERILGAPETEDKGQRWWSNDGELTLLTQSFDPDLAQAWHRAAQAANSEPEALEAEESEFALASAGVLVDGRRFYTITLRRGQAWPTIYLAGGPDAARALDFMRSSLVEGEAEPWEMPRGGVLEATIQETMAQFGHVDELEAFLPPDPVGVGRPDATNASGTAFYVGPRVLLTASHVVDSCRNLGLADGTRLTLLASDPELDVAALAADAPSRAWLPLSQVTRGRLGEKLHAAGYPYYNIAGTSLHLTSGNVSSLADVNDDRRFFSFSAPVQPGNSGGPLIDGQGGVMGLVVSRLSERYIAEATGTLPQNINYGLSRFELVRFLDRNAISPEPAGLARFDMELDGLPDGFEAAVVPILCD
jgi:serine protease Do